jgi:predicted DNA-binding transcriptional regulator AlpA
MKGSVQQEWYSTGELCVYLGISVAHLYRMMKKDVFPRPVKIGRMNKWNKIHVEKFLFSKMTTTKNN